MGEEVLYELLEHCSHLGKLLAKSEVSLNDGDLKNSQKYTKEAVAFLGIMKNDVIKETLETFDVLTNEANDYDLPSVIVAIEQIFDLTYNIGLLIGLEKSNQNDAVKNTCNLKINKNLNTIIQIFNELYNN